MPDMDGPTTAKAIRADIKEFYKLRQNDSIEQEKDLNLLSSPYICCLTAYRQEVYKNQALSNGMNDFKTKPLCAIDLQELLLKLNLVEDI